MSENLKFMFEIETIEVDGRKDSFRPHKIILTAEPPICLVVELSITPENIYNCEEFITSQLTEESEPKPQPVLTTKGLKALTIQIEDALNPTTETEDDWDDTTETKSSTSDDDNWDEPAKNEKEEEW
jgi:hypothetical protein